MIGEEGREMSILIAIAGLMSDKKSNHDAINQVAPAIKDSNHNLESFPVIQILQYPLVRLQTKFWLLNSWKRLPSYDANPHCLMLQFPFPMSTPRP